MDLRRIVVKSNVDLTELGLYQDEEYISSSRPSSKISIIKDNLFFKEKGSGDLNFNNKIDLIKSSLRRSNIKDFISSVEGLRNKSTELMSLSNKSIHKKLMENDPDYNFDKTCLRCGKVLSNLEKKETCNNCDLEIEESMFYSKTFSQILMSKAKINIKKW